MSSSLPSLARAEARTRPNLRDRTRSWLASRRAKAQLGDNRRPLATRWDALQNATLFSRVGGEPKSGQPALLLLHAPGSSGAELVPLAEALARRHVVVVPDLPGHGGRSSGEQLRPADLAKALLELMEAVSACEWGIVTNKGSWETGTQVAKLSSATTLFMLAPMANSNAVLPPQVDLFSPLVRPMDLQLIEGLNTFKAAPSTGKHAVTTELSADVVILRGAQDETCTRFDARAVALSFLRAELLEIQAAGWDAAFEKPEATVRAIADVLKRASVSDSAAQ